MLFAYLDPGSGSALLGTVFALVGAAVFSLKGIVYRLLGGGAAARGVEDTHGIAIFSEGRAYWGTFRPIVEELVRRGIPFSYFTYDLEDPALTLAAPGMFARLHDRDKASSYVKLSNIEAKVCLATTPNIGTPGYPIRRSRRIGTLVHVFHSADNVETYMRGSLDHYDAVLLAGGYQAAAIRELEAKRGLAPKELVPAGLPYLDDLEATRKTLPPREEGGAPTVLVAPSWGEKSCLNVYGIGFVCDLAEAGFRVVLRPHPQSYRAEPGKVAEWRKATAAYANVAWDSEVRPIASLARADVLVSDVSAVRFDYAYLFGRPVVTLPVPLARSDAYEAADLSSIWVEEAAPRIGRVLAADEVGRLADVVRDVLARPAARDVRAFRDATVANFGASARAVVDYLVARAGIGEQEAQ